MNSTKPSLPKGTRDFSPEQMAKRLFIMDAIRHTFQLYGFLPLETPAMENLSVLTGKYGEEGDQLLFKILNSGDFLADVTTEDINKGSKHLSASIAEKGLRYDLTFLVIRLDLGIALHDPYDTGKKGYYNIPKFKDGLGLHFAIGYPF